MVTTGIALAVLSGLFNGLFTTPVKLESLWEWENIWLVEVVVSCLIMPIILVAFGASGWFRVLRQAPRYAVVAALLFGFVWGFGATCFGKSVDRIGISMANTLVIGLSSALGSWVPLFMKGEIQVRTKEIALFAGVIALLGGVAVCGKAGRIRDGQQQISGVSSAMGYFFVVAAGVMSAIFNIWICPRASHLRFGRRPRFYPIRCD